MKTRFNKKSKGSAYLIAVSSFALMLALAIVLSHGALADYHISVNTRNISRASNAAQSGLCYAQELLDEMRSDTTTGDMPDMLEVLYQKLGEKITCATVTKSAAGDAVYVSPITLGGEKFALEFNVTQWQTAKLHDMGTAFDDDPEEEGDDELVASEIMVTSTGSAGNATKKVACKFSVEVDKQMLHYAITSTNILIFRGNLDIQGDILSTWGRTEIASAFPFNMGHTNAYWRSQENINISGKLYTSLSESEFNSTNWLEGFRHTDMIDKLEYNAPENGKLTYDDFNTSKYRDLTTPGILADSLASNSQSKEVDRTKFRNLDYGKNGAANRNDYYLRGYKDEEGIWWRGTFNSYTKQWTMISNETVERTQTISGESIYDYPQFAWYGNSVKLPETYLAKNSYGNWVQKTTYHQVYKPAPNPDEPHIKYMQWTSFKGYWRKCYENFNQESGAKQKFKNLRIPPGSNAYFKNCVFEGVTYIDTNEVKDLPNQYSQQYEDSEANNVVFENCTFKGPIITAVPKDFKFINNAISFEGKTVFDVEEVEQVVRGTTILAPNFNINLGSLKQEGLSETKFVGLVVGGLVDIRDNAHFEGTVISMADYSYYPHWTVNSGGSGSNMGNCESGGETEGMSFTPSQNIKIKPNPDNVIPLGVKRKYMVRYIKGSFTHIGS